MQFPPSTADLFAWLSQGNFVCVDSPLIAHREWFFLLQSQEQAYRAYFAPLGFRLETGEGYYFFSREEKKVLLEDRLDKALKYLDWLSLCWELNPQFGVGLRFSLMDYVPLVERNPPLLRKLQQLGLRGNPQTAEDALRLFVKELEKASFLAEESEEQFRILASFDYLIRLLQRIQLNSQQG